MANENKLDGSASYVEICPMFNRRQQDETGTEN